MKREQLVEDFFTSAVALQRAWREQFHARLGDSKLSFGQMGILMCLQEKQPINSKQIAEYMHNSKSSIAQLLDGLDQLGYIVRQPDPADRRIVYVGLSKAGADKLKSIQDKRREFFTHMTDSLSKDELSALNQLQNKMLQSFKDKNA